MRCEILFTAALLLGTAGCGGTEKMSASSTLPSVEGELECGEAANDNTSIDLKVQHLANPERLTPPAANYVVWTRVDKDGPAQNIGALEVDKNLNGRLRTVTALRRFELFVTAEGSGQAQTPTGQPLMWANCNR